MNSLHEKKITRSDRRALKQRVLKLALPPNYADLVSLQLPHLKSPEGHKLICRVRNLQASDAQITHALEVVAQEMEHLKERLQAQSL